MDRLAETSRLVVSQKKEWGEILSGFETKNKYIISDDHGEQLGYAAEVGGSLLARWFLKALRPFSIALLDEYGEEVLRIQRPFRFYFHTAEILDGEGNVLGTIKRQFSFLRRIYTVYDSSDNDSFELFGPILHPWTFNIREDGQDVGKITKKWSGLLKEGFTDADNFGVEFPHEWDKRLKAIFLGAVFLIDFVHFENKGDS